MATRKRSTTTPKKRAAPRKTAKKAASAGGAAAAALSAGASEPAQFTAPPEPDPGWLTAVRAAESKKAEGIRVLDIRGASAFADFFVICTGNNPKQVQAIAEEVDVQLGKRGEHAISLEGFKNAEWVLADYGDMIVHVFSQKARDYYQLERLWNQAKDVEIPPV